MRQLWTPDEWLLRRIAVRPTRANTLLWRWDIRSIYARYKKEVEWDVALREFICALERAGLETWEHNGEEACLMSEGWALEDDVTPKMLLDWPE